MSPKYVRITDRVPLTREQRDDIVRRAAAGERPVDLAREFGISPQAIDNLRKLRATDQAAGGLGRQLSPEETKALKEKLETTKPADHYLVRHNSRLPEIWTRDRAHALAEKMTGRVLKKHPINKLFKEWFPTVNDWVPPKPGEANLEIDDADIPKELRRDKAFMEYIRSPVARQIRARELELARERYEKQQQRLEADAAEEDAPGGQSVARPVAISKPLVRTGKYKASKGSPFTKPKKKKK